MLSKRWMARHKVKELLHSECCPTIPEMGQSFQEPSLMKSFPAEDTSKMMSQTRMKTCCLRIRFLFFVFAFVFFSFPHFPPKPGTVSIFTDEWMSHTNFDWL